VLAAVRLVLPLARLRFWLPAVGGGVFGAARGLSRRSAAQKLAAERADLREREREAQEERRGQSRDGLRGTHNRGILQAAPGEHNQAAHARRGYSGRFSPTS
jgi:hypothetical protein